MPNLNAGFIDVGYERDAFYTQRFGCPLKHSKRTKLVITGKQPVSKIDKFKLKDIEKKGRCRITLALRN